MKDSTGLRGFRPHSVAKLARRGEVVVTTDTPIAAQPTRKHCGCGKSYTYPEWRALKYKGTSTFEWGEIHELRDCSCGSTIVVLLAEGEPE